MTEFLFENKEIINIIFGIIIGLIPAFCNLKKGRENRNLNWKGWSFLVICFTFILFSSFIICQVNKRIKPDDIILKLSLRSPMPFSSYQEISDKIPKKILAPLIEIEKSNTSGIFEFQNINSGKGHASESKFVNYICYVSGNNSIENFPKNIEDINPKNVILYLSLKKYFECGYSLNGPPKLILRGSIYEGNIDLDNDKIEFSSK
ncbi:hypothetical protein [Flavobacterium sp.]|uniref:hypothetical protein n=1 Tax=Flavobacterium sp. TaxID=239 RepID=UPI0026061D59|nr:hypothetical protein [Flavobacterium sp.]